MHKNKKLKATSSSFSPLLPYIAIIFLLLLIMSPFIFRLSVPSQHVALAFKPSPSNNNITVGNPFYIEYDKITSTVPGIPISGDGHATGVTFSGNGTVKGIGFTETGRALIIPVSKTIVGIFGGLAIKANDVGNKANGNAALSFREVVHMTPAGTMQGSGAAVFNETATGNLSFLSNTVAMFTDNGNKDGTKIIKAWEWKYR